MSKPTHQSSFNLLAARRRAERITDLGGRNISKDNATAADQTTAVIVKSKMIPPKFPEFKIKFRENYPTVLSLLQFFSGYNRSRQWHFGVNDEKITEALNRRVAFIIDVCNLYPGRSNYQHSGFMREVWILTNGHAILFSVVENKNPVKMPCPFNISNITEEVVNKSTVVSQCCHKVKTVQIDRKYYFRESKNLHWSPLRDCDPVWVGGITEGPIMWGYYDDYLINTELYTKTIGELIPYLQYEDPTNASQVLEMINSFQKIMEREGQLIAQKMANGAQP